MISFMRKENDILYAILNLEDKITDLVNLLFDQFLDFDSPFFFTIAPLISNYVF